MDAAETRARFAESGMVRIDGAFSRAEAASMRRTVAGFLEREHGLFVDDSATWPQGWFGGMKAIKRRAVFGKVLENDAVLAALDAVFAEGGWRRPTNPGGQILFTLPKPGPWVLPDGWHMDCGFESPTWPVPGVKIFGFFDTVEPCGGGTMLLPGIHRVVSRYRESLPPGTGGGRTNWRRFLRSDPWLAALLEGASMPDGGRSLVGTTHEVDGLPVEVMELTGEPGDVVITHLHVYHSAAPNTAGRPRQMIGKGVLAAGSRQGSTDDDP